MIEKQITRSRWAWFGTKPGTAVQFLAGAGIVVIGSRLLVDGAVGVASQLGIPSIVIGLTVVALGTSLPELITALSSTRKAASDLAVGNVLGANIANLTLVIGTATLVQDVTMDRQTQVFNFPAMLIIMLVLCWVLHSGRRVTRREGAILLGIYGTYLATVVVLALVVRG